MLENFKVLQASNGLEALAVLEVEPCPDLILMDLSMPNMDGAEFIRKLKTHPKCSNVKVIVISGWDDLAERAKTLGADGHLRKPVDLIKLQREVQRMIRQPVDL